jgi:carboxyl-terminal processing protease
MIRHPPTVLALLLGAVLGFALAVSGGVFAQREPVPADLPWQDARLLAEVIERVQAEYVDGIGEQALMQHAIRGMVAGLDGHSAFLDQDEYADLRIASEGSYSGIGVEVSYESGAIVVVAAIEGSPADRAGLLTGDVIVAIDGRPVDSGGLADAITRMRGEPGTRVRVSVEREASEEPIEFLIERAQVEVHSVRHEMIEPGFGYLRISHFSETTPTELAAALAALRGVSDQPLTGLVVDLRNNPGGVLEAAVDVADAFLDHGLIVSADGRTREARFRLEATPGDLARDTRLAVLVNGGSASGAEIVAGALRDHGRAQLLGRRSFGKGSVQTVLPLSAGHALKLTTSRYYTPSGASIHEKGIVPDIELPRPEPLAGAAVPLPGTPLADRDQEVRRALDWLKSPEAARDH